MWSQQWNLHGSQASLRPFEAWSRGFDGFGVTIAIVDDGLDYNHDDVRERFQAVASYDFNDNDPDVMPISGDGHGTMAAGCAAAASNLKCAVGVAPMASLSGIRLIAADTTDLQEAAGLNHKTQLNHVFSNSWGPFDDGERLEGPGRALEAAFKQAVEEGRGGKGSVFVWASGNGRQLGDSCNYDGYANRRETIPFGAIDGRGELIWYSEGCAALYAVVPAGGGNSGTIRTIDQYNRCYPNFSGTSSGAPQAAGVVALMLSARPDLTWRDVQHVIAKSAIKTDVLHRDWLVNGGGFHHNQDYGFGRIDANRSVTFAQQHTLVPPATSYDTGQKFESIPIPDVQGQTLVKRWVVQNSNVAYVEHVDLTLSATHKRRGELWIALRSPFGTVSRLMEPHTADQGENFDTRVPVGNKWRFGSVRHWGEQANGEWSFEIIDKTPGNAVAAQHLDSWQLTIYGHAG